MRFSIIVVPILLFTFILTSAFNRHPNNRVTANQILPATSFNPPQKSHSTAVPSVTVRPIFPGLAEFAAQVVNGDASQPVGVYVEDKFILPIVQQPENQPAYVSEINGVATLFSLPAKYGVLALLGHNYLAGAYFDDLQAGDEIVIVFGDGRSDIYNVSVIQSYQALEPSSAYSSFIDLDSLSGQQLSSADLFERIYTTPNRLVFQTCIDAYGDPAWGRLFVTAEKVSSLPILLSPAINYTQN